MLTKQNFSFFQKLLMIWSLFFIITPFFADGQTPEKKSSTLLIDKAQRSAKKIAYAHSENSRLGQEIADNYEKKFRQIGQEIALLALRISDGLPDEHKEKMAGSEWGAILASYRTREKSLKDMKKTRDEYELLIKKKFQHFKKKRMSNPIYNGTSHSYTAFNQTFQSIQRR